MNERGWNVKLAGHREESRAETASRGLERDASESERRSGRLYRTRMSMKQSNITKGLFFSNTRKPADFTFKGTVHTEDAHLSSHL